MAKRKNAEMVTPEESRKMICNNLSFAAAEAYKLLRTNVLFSLPGEDGCKVIGVTSALRGEGKSTTSINLAYTTALTGKKVLLLEADMRLPNIARRMDVAPRPGLSNLLVGQSRGGEVIQRSRQLDNLWIITAGDIPPNPAELLGSRQMEIALKSLGQSFDVIIVDLPPVTVVSDAVIVSRLVHGMVIVVRQDFCDKVALDETVRQLRFADTKILGFVMSGADYQNKGYKRYGYGKGGKNSTSKYYGYGAKPYSGKSPKA